MKDTVYIYAGENPQSSVLTMMLKNFSLSFGKNGLKVAPIFGKGILEEEWAQSALALILGGMESTMLRQALSRNGVFCKQIIRSAHEKGVHIVGFCGGAYICWNYINFRGEGNYKREGEGFGLYPRTSPGAASGFTPKDFTGMSDSAAIISLRHTATGQDFHSFYFCGPYFPKTNMPENANSLASAIHPITGQEYVMAVQMPAQNGCGSISLYGHHPEYLAEFINVRTREVPSIPRDDERLRRGAIENERSLLLGFNLMLYDLKKAMGLSYNAKQLIVPQRRVA